MGEAVMTSKKDDESLPKMVLKVLLVEADDCTRQIIAALLRKCSYRGWSFGVSTVLLVLCSFVSINLDNSTTKL